MAAEVVVAEGGGVGGGGGAAGAVPREVVPRAADLQVAAVVKVAAHPAHPAVDLPEVAAEMFPGVACPE